MDSSAARGGDFSRVLARTQGWSSSCWAEGRTAGFFCSACKRIVLAIKHGVLGQVGETRGDGGGGHHNHSLILCSMINSPPTQGCHSSCWVTAVFPAAPVQETDLERKEEKRGFSGNRDGRVSPGEGGGYQCKNFDSFRSVTELPSQWL